MEDTRIRRKIVRIKIENPPVNALNLATRRQVLAELQSALQDDEVAGIVLLGAGARFSGGADVREFNKPEALEAPLIVDVGRAIEASSKPVVAAIEGVALGGGLELAMFCHFRVAAASARLGLPEVLLGLLPGAGGTQRLPRLIGANKAIDWMTKGHAASAVEALAVGLVDEVAGENLEVAAEALLLRHLETGDAHPVAIRQSVQIEGDIQEFFAQARSRARALKRGPAPEAIVDCVEAAATLTPEQAARVELTSFERLATTTQSLALRHLFFAERAAARIDGLDPSAKPRPVSRIGVLGAGTMGTGIAMAFANSGYSVILTDTSDAAMARSRTVREKAYASAIKRGRMSAAAAEQKAALISERSSLEAMSQCQLVIEAVVERMDVKQAVLGQLSRVLEPGAIIASNTSYLDIDVLAGSTGRPADFLGLHFFSPAHVMKLVEVVLGRETSAEVLVTAMDVVKRIGKTGVLARVCDGFIGNRMIDRYFLQANELLMEGASPAEVDSALRDFGFAMGPFEMSDMAGNDIGWLTRKRRLEADSNYSFPVIADAICERGWFGQKTGKGHYVYEEGGREPKNSAEFDALLSQLRNEAGITVRPIEPKEIVERCVYALVNEGARILQEGIAQRASDIDVVYVRGYGFPDLKGGPMHYAQSVGIERVISTLGEFHRRSGDPFWVPSPMLAKLAPE